MQGEPAEQKKRMKYGKELNSVFFFFNDTATTEIYTLSLHDALPICDWRRCTFVRCCCFRLLARGTQTHRAWRSLDHLAIRGLGTNGSSPGTLRERYETFTARCNERSEEHTSELQSRLHLVCRLLLEKKKYKLS